MPRWIRNINERWLNTTARMPVTSSQAYVNRYLEWRNDAVHVRRLAICDGSLDQGYRIAALVLGAPIRTPTP